jgi:hypothetical protein
MNISDSDGLLPFGADQLSGVAADSNTVDCGPLMA